MVRDTLVDYTNFKDGDYQSIIADADDWKEDSVEVLVDGKLIRKVKITTGNMYATGTGTSMPRVSDKSRVYKGGSWKDRTFWLGPGTRRYMDERKAANDLGFRCAMTHLGDSNLQ